MLRGALSKSRLSALCLAASLAMAGTLRAQDQAVAQTPPSVEAAMRNAMPGPPHAELAERVGTYVTTTRSWTQPNAGPVESKGTATLSMIVGGRFLYEQNSGVTTGQPYEGVRIIGFNNASRKYEAIWLYTGSAAAMLLTGVSADGGKTIQWIAVFEDRNNVRVTLQATTRFVNKDTFVVDLTSRTLDGKDGPRFETTYERQKDATAR